VSRAFETSKAHQGKVSSSGESSTNTDEEDVTTITKVATSPTPPPSWTSTLPSAEAYARCAVFGRRQRRYAVFRWIRRAVRRTLGPEGDLEPALPVLSIIRPPGAPPPSWLLSSSSESGQGAAAGVGYGSTFVLQGFCALGRLPVIIGLGNGISFSPGPGLCQQRHRQLLQMDRTRRPICCPHDFSFRRQ